MTTPHPSTPETRAALGQRLRAVTPHEAHAEVNAAGRPDPVEILAQQIPSRVPELVPLRHERMRVSPFTFFRGAAAVMAADLSSTPVSGITTQLCGDAHLANFGMFASAERRLLFDVNDFDETIPGPWEWDVKRLTASLVVAGQHKGFSAKQNRRIVRATVARYQEAMQGFAAMGNLAVWYSKLDVEDEQRALAPVLDKKATKRLQGNIAKTRSRTHVRSLKRLTEEVSGGRRFINDPPVMVRLHDLVGQDEAEATITGIKQLIDDYAESLDNAHCALVRSYDFVDIARKVVGVGSVGTRCWVILLLGRDEDDPLFLQVKEAQESVLAPYLPASAYASEGMRVVAGQRLMQAAGDIFLGARSTIGLDGRPRDFYVRQLQDWKGSADVEAMRPTELQMYGELCGWTLARAHARSGDRIAIAGYLGEDDTFARAISTFSETYAEMNERDQSRFDQAVAADALLGTAPA